MIKNKRLILTIYLVSYLTFKVIAFNKISKTNSSIKTLKGGVDNFIEY